jgi:hypothetical protein
VVESRVGDGERCFVGQVARKARVGHAAIDCAERGYGFWA